MKPVARSANRHDRSIRFFNRKRILGVLALAGLISLVLLSTPPTAVHAADSNNFILDAVAFNSWVQNLNPMFFISNMVTKLVFGFLAGIVGGIALLIGQLLISIIEQVILPQQTCMFINCSVENATTLYEVVRQAWNSMLQIANIIFFVALFVFSILIITRQAGYNFKKAVVALITAAALANLSYIMAGFIVEVGDALKNSASSLPGLSAGLNILSLKSWLVGWLTGLLQAANPFTDVTKYLVATGLQMAEQCLVAYIFFRLAWVLIERTIRIMLLVIFAPVQAALSILPAKELQKLGATWFADLIKWTLVLPVVWVIIGIAQLIMPEPGATIGQFTRLVTSFGEDAQLASTSGIFQMVIAMVLLYSASNVPKMLSVPISGLTKSLSDAPDIPVKAGYKAATGAIKEGISTQVGTYLEGAKAGKGMIGTTYRTFSDMKERAKTNLESLKKVNATTTAQRLTPTYQTLATQADTTHKAAFEKFYNARRTAKDPTFADLSLDDNKPLKTHWENEFNKYDPSLAAKTKAAQRSFKVAQGGTGERIIYSGHEDLKKQIRDAEQLAKIELDRNGKVSDTTKDTLSGLIQTLKDEAKKGTTASVGYKNLANTLRDDDEFMSLLSSKTAGAGYTFGIDQYDITERAQNEFIELERKRTANDPATNFAALAQAEQTIADRQADIDTTTQVIDNTKNSTVITANQTVLGSSTDLLQKIAAILGSTPAQTAVADISPEALDALDKNPAIRDQVKKILRDPDASPDGKKQAITDLLNRSLKSPIIGAPPIINLDKVADALVDGGADIDKLRDIKIVVDGHIADPTGNGVVLEQIQDVLARQQADIDRTEIQTRLNQIKSGDAYDNAISTYLTANPGSQTQLETRIQQLADQIEETTRKNGGKNTISLDAAQTDPATKEEMFKLLDDLKMTLLITPGKTVKDATEYSRTRTLADSALMLHRIHKAVTKPKTP